MEVPFLDLKIQYKTIKPEIDSAIQKVLDNTALILGQFVEELKKELEKMDSLKNCSYGSSGQSY